MTTTTVFAGTNDGWIYCTDVVFATAAGGASPVISTTATNAYSGCLTAYEVHETYVDFLTSAVPTGESVSAATLSMWCLEDASTNDYTIEASIYNWGGSLTTANWRTPTQLGNLTIIATFPTASLVVNAYSDFSSNASMAGQINTAGTTSIVIATDKIRTSTAPTANEYNQYASADTAGTTNDPKLVITSLVVTSLSAAYAPGNWPNPSRAIWHQRSYPNQFTAAAAFDPTLSGGISSNYRWQSWLDPNRAEWQQRDRINANLTGTAANPLPSPLDAYAQQAQHNIFYSDRRNYPQQRVYIDPNQFAALIAFNPILGGLAPNYKPGNWPDPNRADWQQKPLISPPSLLSTALLEDALLGDADVRNRARLQPATHYDRRQVPTQKSLVSDPRLLTTALLEDALLGRADNERHAWFRRDPYWTPPGERQSNPSLLTTALLEGPLLGIHPRDLWRRDWDYYRWLPRDLRNANTVITIPLPSPLDVYAQAALHVLFFTDRRQYPQQRIYIDPNQFAVAAAFNPTLAGYLAQSYWAWRRTPYWTPPGAPGHDPNLLTAAVTATVIRWLMFRRRGIRGTARPLRSRWLAAIGSNVILDENGIPILDENGSYILDESI